jgi:ATP diphosphatase
VGFDWARPADVVGKIREEVEEIAEVVGAHAPLDRERAEEEMGDLLFSIANLSRQLGIEPEAALRKANDKFTRRFTAMETAVGERGARMADMTLEELESEWQKSKKAERMT